MNQPVFQHHCCCYKYFHLLVHFTVFCGSGSHSSSIICGKGLFTGDICTSGLRNESTFASFELGLVVSWH